MAAPGDNARLLAYIQVGAVKATLQMGPMQSHELLLSVPLAAGELLAWYVFQAQKVLAPEDFNESAVLGTVYQAIEDAYKVNLAAFRQGRPLGGDRDPEQRGFSV